jgi:photosystem II stability/assembly factor-like uncharacterized protein
MSDLRSVYFSSPAAGWIAGSDGAILKTITGGGTFIDSS